MNTPTTRHALPNPVSVIPGDGTPWGRIERKAAPATDMSVVLHAV
ncbi:hypothetical protein [Marinobacterium weihaiense]|nr:hypothetical protein [Marinobacterium weihaiense]